MVTFTRNPYDFADDQDINSAVVKVDLTYKDKPFPLGRQRRHLAERSADAGVNKGVGVTVPTNLGISPKSFTNATLSSKNHHMATISLKRVSSAAVLQLYIYIGSMTAQDFQHFDDLTQMSKNSPIIFDGYVNVTLFRGNSSDAFDALSHNKLNLFEPVWLYHFRFVILHHSTMYTCMQASETVVFFKEYASMSISKRRLNQVNLVLLGLVVWRMYM